MHPFNQAKTNYPGSIRHTFELVLKILKGDLVFNTMDNFSDTCNLQYNTITAERLIISN